jgi:ABC-2 type transport system ATP-binding protein
MKVQVKNLRKEFGKTVAVDNISFSFDSGQIFGFVGPNGAGKTTTMRIISTIEEPTSGDVFLNGISISEEPELARRTVGYVPDSLPAHADVTVDEYLDFYARAYGLRGKKRTQAVQAIEEFTNVTGIREKHLKALSKGMKQRVSLGRALIYDPDVLVLDEPAAGLDPRARVELRELLVLLCERKKAILISSHILTELTEICNGVVIIERGKLLETGTIDEVMKKSALRRTVLIRLLASTDQNLLLIRELLQTPFVENAREVANEVQFDLAGDESAACDVLGRLIQKKFQVVEFRQARANLEDLFMKVTKGGVQ